MNTFVQQKVISKVSKLLHTAIRVGALSLVFASNAFAGGGSSTPPPAPPCGGWNTVGTINFPRSSFAPNYGGRVFRLPKNKLTPLSGAIIRVKNSQGEEIATTNANGIFQTTLNYTGNFEVSIKMPGHRFASKEIAGQVEGALSEYIYMNLCQ